MKDCRIETPRGSASVAPLYPSNARFLSADEKITAFVEIMRANVLSGEIRFRLACPAVIDQIEVGDAEIRIHGRPTDLFYELNPQNQ